MNDQRKQDRGQTNEYLVAYYGSTGEPLGRVRNLTTGGAMLISEERVAVPVCVQCRMVLPDIIEGCREISFVMESKYCNENKVAQWFETGYEFVDLTDHHRRIFQRLADEWMTVPPPKSPTI